VGCVLYRDYCQLNAIRFAIHLPCVLNDAVLPVDCEHICRVICKINSFVNSKRMPTLVDSCKKQREHRARVRRN
jgi:hypothetical protein